LAVCICHGSLISAQKKNIFKPLTTLQEKAKYLCSEFAELFDLRRSFKKLLSWESVKNVVAVADVEEVATVLRGL